MKFLIILCGVFVFGCSSTPYQSLSQYKPMDPAGVSKFAADDNTANVIIARDSAFGGSLCDSIFFINGETISRISNGSKLPLKLTTGMYMFGLASACMDHRKPDFEYETEVRNEKNVFRLYFVYGSPTPAFGRTSLIK